MKFKDKILSSQGLIKVFSEWVVLILESRLWKLLIVLALWSVTTLIYFNYECSRSIIIGNASSYVGVQENMKRTNNKVIQNEERSNTFRPIQNVIFLKTHKTGSSTVTNIMQRYAKAHKLNVALPRCDHRFCYPHKFNKSFLYLHNENETYNILFNHAVFHKENMLNIMTGPNTKVVTIIREPYSQFDSTAQYLNFRKFYNISNETLLLDGFFQNTDHFLTEFLRSSDLTDGAGTYSLAKNPNAFDLGFDVWNETSEYIESMIDSLKRDFNLVMIMEYMEESLVLLKNEMNWNLEDVVFYIHNARKVKDKNTNDVKRIKDKILNWNKLDAAIYNYFNRTFWMKVRNAPPGFYEDVKKLKEWNQHLVDHCFFFKPSNLSANLFKRYATLYQGNFCSDFLNEDLNFTNWFKIERYFNIERKKFRVKYFVESKNIIF